MRISDNKYYIAEGKLGFDLSYATANAMVLELAAYNIKVEKSLINRISTLDIHTAKSFCNSILKDYTVGKLNPPLFQDWEKRTFFSFDEVVCQILGYIFQISGRDLQDPDYMDDVLSKVRFDKAITVTLATQEEAKAKFLELVDVKVALDKKGQENLKEAGKQFWDIAKFSNRIYSDEARIAVLLGASERVGILEALSSLKCKASDVLRYAAALNDFTSVKLPSDVIYAKLTWAQRTSLLNYLNSYFDYDELMEAMGQNREAWTRFFKHLHLFNQKDFVNRYPIVGLSARISQGFNQDSIPVKYNDTFVKLLDDSVIELLSTGNTAYRTFASRVDTAIKEKDFSKMSKLFANNGGYLLRNIGHISNGVKKTDEGKFVELVRSKLQNASVDVLFSILSINIDAKFRVIDIKGNTVVEPASYSPTIRHIQGDIEREIYRRWGYDGQVIVSDDLDNNIVPFLSKNSNLARGSRIPFGSKDYLYFFMHWVQSSYRTDLDHSYIAFDSNWNTQVVYFGHQANQYLTHGGDITNAPAPHGASEYGMIRIKDIPKNIKYIAPVINVYTGDNFKALKEAYAGFMFSDSTTFKVERDFTRYDLTEPAMSNIPFIVDVENREIVVLDFNNRVAHGCTAHSEIGNIKNLISAVNDKNYITIGKLAKILSGDSSAVSLEIRKNPRREDEVSPENLVNIIK